MVRTMLVEGGAGSSSSRTTQEAGAGRRLFASRVFLPNGRSALHLIEASSRLISTAAGGVGGRE